MNEMNREFQTAICILYVCITYFTYTATLMITFIELPQQYPAVSVLLCFVGNIQHEVVDDAVDITARQPRCFSTSATSALISQLQVDSAPHCSLSLSGRQADSL